MVVVICLIFGSESSHQSALVVLFKFWHYLDGFRVYVLAIVRETREPAVFAYVIPLTHALVVLDKPRDVLSVELWNPLPKRIWHCYR